MILPFGLLYFVTAIVVYKMQCLHVFSTKYESGGVLFPVACHRLLVGLMFAQLTLIGYLSLREGYAQATVRYCSPTICVCLVVTHVLVNLHFFQFLSPIIILTYQRMKYFYKQYQLPSMYVTMEQAQYIDKEEIEILRRREFDADAYKQPVLTEQPVEPQPYRRDVEETFE